VERRSNPGKILRLWQPVLERGMRLAFEANAKARSLLWLNNDTLLYPEALERLISISASLGDKAIVVGSTQDPQTGEHTYGGVYRPSRWKRTHYEPILPADKPVTAETFNGNCVLIPSKVAKIAGNLDPGFTHGMGDFDYGHRAWRMGCSAWVAPGYYGTCPRNPITPW
jgi:GT2 family glycosyltransferase